MSKKLRIIFAGTSEFSVRHLDALLLSGHQIIGVFTKPDRPIGRGRKLIANPVKILAEKKGFPIFQPVSLYIKENQQIIATMNADVIVVVAYGLILPQEILTMPRLGCVNIHGSLLPRWRGAAPIQRALLAGDSKTGVTIIRMNMSLDGGNILYKKACLITEEDTSVTLCNKLAKIGQQGLIETLQQLKMGTTTPEVQDERLATYAEKLSKEEARIDWSMSAVQLERCVRAFNPWPMSWIMIEGKPIKILKASVIRIQPDAEFGTILAINKNGIQVATADGILNLESLQPAGKKVMSAQDLLNSRREWFPLGRHLS